MDQLVREHGAALITILWWALGLAGAGFLGLLGFFWLLAKTWASSDRESRAEELESLRSTDKELGRKMEQLKDQELTAFKDKTSQQFAALTEVQMRATAANDLAHAELKGAIGELKLEVFNKLEILDKKMPNGEMKVLKENQQSITSYLKAMAEALKIKLD